MLQEYIPRSREASILDVIFDDIPRWATIDEPDYDPPAPSPSEEDPASSDPGADGGGGGGGYIYCTTGSRTFQLLNESGSSSTAEYRMTASFGGNSEGHSVRRRIYYYQNGVRTQETVHGTTTASSSSYNSTTYGASDAELACDDNQWSWRGRVYDLTDPTEVNGSLKYFKSHAIDMTADSTPVETGTYLSDTEAYITCDFFPNSKHSTVTAQLQYKRTVDSTWTNAGSSATTNGYTERTISRGLTGLTSETQYDIRLVLTRNSVNSTSYTTSTGTFTTLASSPTVTTNSASSVGISDATLSGTVDHNGFDGTLSFRYIDTASYVAPPDDAQGTEVSYGSVTADGTYNKGISGLTASTGYTFWAIYEYTDGGTQKTYGSAATFTTQADPAAGGDEADFMIPLQFDGQYGVAKTVYFTLRGLAASNNDTFYTSTAPVQADVKIMKDGTYDSTSDNAPAQVDVANIPEIYSLTLSATEMQAEIIDVVISDADGPAFRDLHIQVRTAQRLSELDLDATQGPTDASALTAIGNGAGHGATFQGGATGLDVDGILGEMILRASTSGSGGSPTGSEFELDASANGTNDYYNGCIVMLISSTGAGQSRVITDYDGTTKIATLDAAWTTAPLYGTTRYIIIPGARPWNIAAAAELSGVPTETSSYGDKLSFLFQRFAFKVDQTATVQTWYKSNSSSTLGTKTVADDGSTQTLGKMA